MNADAVLESFRDRRPIRDTHMNDPLVIAPDPFFGQIDCVACHFEHFSATCTQFHELVRFANCKLDCLDFYATYFLKGLTMDGCVVSDRVTFQSGGHNEKTHPFAISNTRFDSFVDFEDCWFTGPIRFDNVVFARGTNLLGNQVTPMVVSFDLEPELVNVEGKLNINTYNLSHNSDNRGPNEPRH